MTTAKEYDDETRSILMAGTGRLGMRPYEVRDRVEKLVAIEIRAQGMCAINNVPKGFKCPYCNHHHK